MYINKNSHYQKYLSTKCHHQKVKSTITAIKGTFKQGIETIT